MPLLRNQEGQYDHTKKATIKMLAFWLPKRPETIEHSNISDAGCSFIISSWRALYSNTADICCLSPEIKQRHGTKVLILTLGSAAFLLTHPHLALFTTKQLVPKHNCVGRHCLLHSDWGTEAASLFGLSWQTIWIMLQGCRPSATSLRCEDNLAAASVTPLIIRVDSVDLAV